MSNRILVAEDSATQAEVLSVLLEDGGYEVVTVPSGELALQALEREQFDLVLSDVVMPGINGYELCRQIKSDPEMRTLPVVLLTSLVDPLNIVRGLECGADNYITKPYEPEHLLARIRHVMDVRRLRRGAKTSMGVSVRFLDNDFTITSDREQILDLFISSVEDVVRTNEALQASQRELADAHAQLESFAREKAREARASTERYRALMQNAGDAIFVLDMNGRIVEGNARVAEVLGVPVAELTGRCLDEFVVDRERAKFKARLRKTGEDQHLESGEWTFLHVDGHSLCCEVSASVAEFDEGDLFVVIVRDISERRAAEEALRQSNQRLEALIRSAPVAIIALDAKFRVQLWNPASERILGWTESEVLHRELPATVVGGEEQLEPLRAQLFQGHSVAGVEIRPRRKDDGVLEATLSAAPLYDQSGEFSGVMAVLEDISERKHAQEVLRQSEEADRANRAKSEFLSRMSHELRTPLNAILGFGQLLEGDVQRDEDRESVEQILRAGRHLLALIDEVLDLAKIEAGRMSLSIEPVSVAEVVEQVAGLVRPMAVQRSLTLQTDAAQTSDLFVHADLQRLKQVMLNLLSNAIKYNRPGGTVRLSVSSDREGRVKLLVRDTGHGISAERQSRLFLPFERLGAEHHGIEGTGLGLALSKGLVEAMGGSIGLESVEGEGSTFWVELAGAESLEVARPLTVHLTDTASDPGDGSIRTVLYIEDNLSNLRLVERVFTQRPHLRLVAAMQGSMGLELAREHRPDLILLDLNLPDLPGEEVLRRLQTHSQLCTTPVVIISADAMPAQIERLLSEGVTAYLTKPLDVRKFLSVVDSLLEPAKS